MNVNEKKTDATNNQLWDFYYQSYQKDSIIPGIKYPNEHLIRFIKSVSNNISQQDCKVLELGFGNITNMTMMQKLGFSVLGLEVSKEAVRRANAAIKQKGLQEKLSVDVFEGNKLPLPDNSVDIIVGLECVYYNLDQELFAKECYRVLKPGGKIFFTFFSRRNGYMDYIKGSPGAIVEFDQKHPNSRLRGLSLFLFKNRDHFQEIYGNYFDISVGLEEFDLYPIFNSWYHLTGQKKDCPTSYNFSISKPAKCPLDDLLSTENKTTAEMVDNNKNLWNLKYQEMYKSSLVPGSQYPNETMVRFLATRNRGPLNKFFTQIGHEDKIQGEKNENALELMPLNISNLLMVADLKFTTYGLSSSDIVINNSKKALLGYKEKEDIIFLDNYNGLCFPYPDTMFDYIVSEKIGSHMPDPKKLISEIARVTKPEGEILIGYLSPQHGYLHWTKALGEGYYQITSEHPDSTMHGIIIYVQAKERLKKLWGKYFDVEIKYSEFDLYKHFSSFYFVRGKRKITESENQK